MFRFRKQYDEVAAIAASVSTLVDCSDDPGITSQSAAADADINVIAKRVGLLDESPAKIAAVLTQLGFSAGAQPSFGDFSAAGLSYHELMTRVRAAEMQFGELPARVRSAFGNEPALLLDALRSASSGDEKALGRLRDLGMLAPEERAVPAPEGAVAGPGAAAAAPSLPGGTSTPPAS